MTAPKLELSTYLKFYLYELALGDNAITMHGCVYVCVTKPAGRAVGQTTFVNVLFEMSNLLV